MGPVKKKLKLKSSMKQQRHRYAAEGEGEKRAIARVIHSCEESPIEPYVRSPTDNDDACFSQIKQIYSIENGGKRLGSLVYEISSKQNRHDKIAVKVLAYGSDEEMQKANAEVGISCHINGLREENPVFMRTYGYLVCDSQCLPRIWKEELPKYAMLFFMESYDALWYSSENDNVAYRVSNEDQAKCLFFIMAHAIYLLRKRLGGRHGDLYANNILMTENTRGDVFELDLDTHRARVQPPFIPKIIDFGQGWTTRYDLNDWSEQDYRPNDIKELITHIFSNISIDGNIRYDIHRVWNAPDAIQEEMDRKGTKFGEKLYDALMSTEKRACFDPKPVRLMLVLMQTFRKTDGITIENIKKRRTSKEENLGKCMVCNGDAKLWLLGRNAFFCSSYCAQGIGQFACFLPKCHETK